MTSLLRNRSFLILLICVFVIMMGYGVLLPVLPFFLERIMDSGASVDSLTMHFGILTAIYPMTLVISAPLWGRVSDRIGPKTPILLGLGGFVLMQVMIAFSNSIEMLYLARIIGSVFSSFLIPVVNNYISNLTDKSDRTAAMAWGGSAASAGVIIGPGLSGVLTATDLHLWQGSPLHQSIDRFSVPFLIIAGIGLVAFFIALIFLDNPKTSLDQKLTTSPLSILPKEKWSMFKDLLLLTLVLQLAITAFESIFPLFIKDAGIYSVSFIGAGLLVCGLVMAILQPVVAKWGHHVIKQPSKQIAIGFLIAGLTLPVYLMTQSRWIIIVAIIVFGIGSSLIVPNLLAMMSLRDPSSSGWALGMQSSFGGIGQILGPLVGSALYAIQSYLPFIGVSIILVITSMIELFKIDKETPVAQIETQKP